jgi:hypothetical protein
MSEHNSRAQSTLVLPPLSPVSNQSKHRQASTKQSVLQEVVTSMVHHPRTQRMQQQSHLNRWQLVQQMQYRRLLILVYLLLALSLTAVVLGVINYLTLHSLQEELHLIKNRAV